MCKVSNCKTKCFYLLRVLYNIVINKNRSDKIGIFILLYIDTKTDIYIDDIIQGSVIL